MNEQYADNYNDIKGATVMLYEYGIPISTFQIPSKPGKPSSTGVTYASITMQWTKPEHGYDSINKYKVLYRIDRNGQPGQEDVWLEITTDTVIESKKISNLTANTAYIFQIQAITIAGDSPPSDVSIPVMTLCPPLETAATRLLQHATVIKVGENGFPSTYKLQHREVIISRQSLRLLYAINFRSPNNTESKRRQVITRYRKN